MNQSLNALPTPICQPKDITFLYLASPLGRYVTVTILDVALGANARYTA